MQAILSLIGLALFLGLLVFPIWAIMRINTLGNSWGTLWEKIQELETEIRELRLKVLALSRRPPEPAILPPAAKSVPIVAPPVTLASAVRAPAVAAPPEVVTAVPLVAEVPPSSAVPPASLPPIITPAYLQKPEPVAEVGQLGQGSHLRQAFGAAGKRGCKPIRLVAAPVPRQGWMRITSA